MLIAAVDFAPYVRLNAPNEALQDRSRFQPVLRFPGKRGTASGWPRTWQSLPIDRQPKVVAVLARSAA
jgi:hypothetical protein